MRSTITHRRVLAVALPIVLSNITVPLLGVVDTFAVGQIGDPASIAAVGVGAIIIGAIYWIFGFLRMGTTGLAAQASGAGDQREMIAILVRGLIIGLGAGLVFIALSPVLIAGGMWISPVSDAVAPLAESYMQIRILSAPAPIALYAITGWLIAGERTRDVLILQVWMNGLNILLDLYFVLSLGWGVDGVAWATFIAEWTGLVLGLWMCRAALFHPFARAWLHVFDRAQLIKMGSLNSDILLRSLALEGIFVSFLLWGGHFGDVALAANQVLLQFLHVTAYGLDGFAFAAETLVGQAIGRQARQDLRKSIIISSIWAAGVCVLAAIGFAYFGPWAIDQMAKSVEVQQAARIYLPYMVAAPILGCACFMLDGIFIGATRGADMRNMMLISLVVYGVCVLALTPSFGNHGLWIALLISYVARGATLGYKYPEIERSLG